MERYRVTDRNSPKCGKIIRGHENELGMIVERKTKEAYEKCQVKRLPKRHAVYGGLQFGRLGLCLFAREYIKYHSYQFGVTFDYVDSVDAFFDIELHFVCFGLGFRVLWQRKN